MLFLADATKSAAKLGVNIIGQLQAFLGNRPKQVEEG
jgi:hypothetical protein